MWNPCEVRDAILLERDVRHNINERKKWRLDHKESDDNDAIEFGKILDSSICAENTFKLAPFPTDGVVTSKEIAAAFRISVSTWRLRVHGMPWYPKPLPRTSNGSPNYWRVSDVLAVMKKDNIPRRHILTNGQQ